MFLPLSNLIENDKLLLNYEKIKSDYSSFLEKNYFVDYSHEYNLVVDNIEQLPEPFKTGHYWQVCPIIVAKQIIPIISEDIQNCFTANLLMSFKVKPVLAVFSMLEPHSEIEPHSDLDSMIMKNSYDENYLKKSEIVKYHYSIDIPPGDNCVLKVLDETRILKNKDINPFVENSLHSASNKSSLRRGVLIASYLKDEIYPK